jgi:hypothetical protein
LIIQNPFSYRGRVYGYNCEMNNAFFFDSMEAVPLPPEEVRINSVSADPYPDGQRVRIAVEMTPFQNRPWLELTLIDSQGDEIATADVIEPLNYKIELTMHIRKAETAGQYTLAVRLYYPEQADNDRKDVSFEIRAEKDSR